MNMTIGNNPASNTATPSTMNMSFAPPVIPILGASVAPSAEA